MTDPERTWLRRFLLHLHWVLNHSAGQGQAAMAWAHGYRYDGPILKREDMHEKVGLPRELPTPVYPQSEWCVERRVPAGGVVFHGAPVATNVVFPSGTIEECRAWIARSGDGREGHDYAVNTTGRVLDRDEEKKWYAQFGEEPYEGS